MNLLPDRACNKTEPSPCLLWATVLCAAPGLWIRLLLLLTILSSPYLHASSTMRDAPTVSAAEVRQLFARERYEQAYRHALHRYEWGDESLHFELGHMYHQGRGTARDLRLARDHFSLAAERGDTRGMFALGRMMQLGEAGPVEAGKACNWYARAAHRQHLEATYRHGLCLMKASEDPTPGLQQLHQAAMREYPPALSTLLFHYQAQGVRDSIQDPAYTRSVLAVMQNDPGLARRLAREAIEAGDYRAYASLAQSLPQPDAEIRDAMRSIARLFGSPLPDYLHAQTLLQEGQGQRACLLFEKAMNKGLVHAATALGQCYEQGLLKDADGQARACRLYAEASKDDVAASLHWARCQATPDTPAYKPIEAIRTYVSTIRKHPGQASTELAGLLCQSYPSRHLADEVATTRGVLPPATRLCVLDDDDTSKLVFVPANSWLGRVPASVLNLQLSIDGFVLTGLTSTQLDAALSQGNDYVEIKRSAQDVSLKPSGQDDLSLRLRFDAQGQLQQAQRYRKTGDEDEAFDRRLTQLSLQLGAPVENTDPALYQAAHWRLQGWHILLMYDRVQGELQERYTREDEE